MNERHTSKLIAVFLVLVILLFLSVGRQEEHGIKTEMVKGKTVKDSVDTRLLFPVSEEIPDRPELPYKQPEVQYQYKDTGSLRTITETRYILQTVDTAAIIAGYIMKKKYALDVFDNIELGKLTVYPTVQYNRLTGLNYEYTPVKNR